MKNKLIIQFLEVKIIENLYFVAYEKKKLRLFLLNATQVGRAGRANEDKLLLSS